MDVKVSAKMPVFGGANNVIGFFSQLLEGDERVVRRVLDVGCGSDLPPERRLRRILAHCAQLDGVDPSPQIKQHPYLTNRWCGQFADVDIPYNTYDVIFSRCVAEHVEHPKPFIGQACRVLKPGGVMYIMTPHALHPVPAITQALQMLGLKHLMKKHLLGSDSVFPTYYRLNRKTSFLNALRGLRFDCAEFYYCFNVHWQSLVPRVIRFVPYLYDQLVATRFRACAMTLIVKLEKADQ